VTITTKPGQDVVLVGSHPSLGSWSMDDALPLTWTDGHVWRATIELPADCSSFEYKVRHPAPVASQLRSRNVGGQGAACFAGRCGHSWPDSVLQVEHKSRAVEKCATKQALCRVYVLIKTVQHLPQAF
jgi:hypothetical protein